jgi:hypothetical protein
MVKVIYNNLAKMIMYKKQKLLLDKSIRDYLHRDKYKDKFNKAIVEYKKPYSDIEVSNKPIDMRYKFKL